MCVNYVKISCERTRATCCKSFEDYSLCGITFFKKDNSILWGCPVLFICFLTWNRTFPMAEPYVFLLGDIRIPAGKHKKSFGINFSSSKSFKLKGAGRIAFSYEKAMKKGYRSDIPFHIQVRNLLLFIFLFPFRIHREPAFQHTLTLFEDFLDGPERGERKDSQ